MSLRFLIVFEQLNYTKPDGIHAIFIPGIIEFSRYIRTYSSAKFEYKIFDTDEENKNMKKYNSLCSHRIYLSAYREEDAAKMAKWSEDDIFVRNLDADYFRPHSDKYMIEHFNELENDNTMIEFALRTTKEDSIIGFVCLHTIEWNNRSASMAVGIGKSDYRGKGYGTEAIQLMLYYAFQELNLHRVGLDVISNNESAINVYQNIGFVQEGVVRECVYREGHTFDRIFMGILKKEWMKKWMVDDQFFFIRKFTLEDVPDVVEIHNENNPSQLTTVEDMIRQEITRCEDRVLIQYVIDLNGKVIAYCDCGEVNATTTEDALHAWITVHPQFRGKGFGVRLLEESEKFCKMHNVFRLETGMSAEQPHSIKWMEKRGFEYLGSIVELNLEVDSIAIPTEDHESKYEITSLTDEECHNEVMESLFTTLAQPLLNLVVFPGGATMNPSYQEFRTMFVDCKGAESDGQIVIKDGDRLIGYCNLIMEKGCDYAYISYIDLHRDYLNRNLEKALLYRAIVVAKEHNFSIIKTHVEQGSVIKSIIDELYNIGWVESPGRMIWSKSFK